MTSFLVSSAGRRGALVEILREIARSRDDGIVVVVDASPLSAAGRLADEFEIVPQVDSREFVDAVLDVALRNGVDVIIPTIDPEIVVYSENRTLFAQHEIDVWAPSTETARLGFDKWAFFNWLTDHDIPTVETYEVSDARWHDLEGPVVAKPRSGSSSIGVLKALSVERLPEGLGGDYIVQGVATGVELTVDFGVDRAGRFLGAVPRQRLEVRAGEVSKGVTRRVAEVERIAATLAQYLPGMYGVGNTQVFFDPESGRANVIEVNPRFGGGYPLTHAAGADFITALLETNSPADWSVLKWEADLTMLRYDDAVFARGIAGESL